MEKEPKDKAGKEALFSFGVRAFLSVLSSLCLCASVVRSMAPVLVTGGAGFLGGHLVRRLLDEGRRVRVLERPEAPVAHLSGEGVEIVRGDIRDRRAVRDAVRGCRAVYHLAA